MPSSSAPGLLQSRRVQLAILAARYRIPATFAVRDYAEVGGLMTTEPIRRRFRQVGVYAGRVLKGAKPADLPVVQSTKFELVINLNTAGRSASLCRHRSSPAPTR